MSNAASQCVEAASAADRGRRGTSAMASGAKSSHGRSSFREARALGRDAKHRPIEVGMERHAGRIGSPSGERRERVAGRRARRLRAMADAVHDDVLGVARGLALHDDFETVVDTDPLVVHGDAADREQAVALWRRGPRSPYRRRPNAAARRECARAEPTLGSEPVSNASRPGAHPG